MKVKVRRSHGSALRWIAVLMGVLVLGMAVAVPSLLDVLRGKRGDAMALEISGHFSAIKPQVERFVIDRGSWDALLPEQFDDARPGYKGVFDTLGTGMGKPTPPRDAFMGTARQRYALEVGDFTAGRGNDHVLVLRGLREDVCRAFNVTQSKQPDPYAVDPGDRYARGRGCIADPDTGELVAFLVLNAT